MLWVELRDASMIRNKSSSPINQLIIIKAARNFFKFLRQLWPWGGGIYWIHSMWINHLW